MERSKVYVIILNWNGWKDTIECLESVFRNQYYNYKVIVCDNDSADGSLEKIMQWADGKIEANIPDDPRIASHVSPSQEKPIHYIHYTREQAESGGFGSEEPPLILIQTGGNLGFAGGNNVGIRYAMKRDDFEYIWLLNNDTVIDEVALKEMVLLAEEDKSIGIVGSKILYYYQPDVIQTLGGSHHLNWKGDGIYIHPFESDREEFNAKFEIGGYLCGASILTKKQVFKQVGLFDENYFMWAEEVDWCLRIKKDGWRQYYCGNSTIWHKEGASCGKFIVKKILGRQSKRVSLKRFVISGYYDVRNHIYLVRKHFRSKMPFYLLYLITTIIKRMIGIILYDNYKFTRISLLFMGLYHGLFGIMGKTIETSKYNEW